MTKWVFHGSDSFLWARESAFYTCVQDGYYLRGFFVIYVFAYTVYAVYAKKRIGKHEL